MCAVSHCLSRSLIAFWGTFFKHLLLGRHDSAVVLTLKQGPHRSPVLLSITLRLWHPPLDFGFFYSAFVIALVSHYGNCVFWGVFMNCGDFVCWKNESVIRSMKCLKVFLTYYWTCCFQFMIHYIIIQDRVYIFPWQKSCLELNTGKLRDIVNVKLKFMNYLYYYWLNMYYLWLKLDNLNGILVVFFHLFVSKCL